MLKRFLISAAAAAFLAVTAMPADAGGRHQRHHRGGGNAAAAAIIGGIIGLGVGAAIAAQPRYRNGYHPRQYHDPWRSGAHRGQHYGASPTCPPGARLVRHPHTGQPACRHDGHGYQARQPPRAYVPFQGQYNRAMRGYRGQFQSAPNQCYSAHSTGTSAVNWGSCY